MMTDDEKAVSATWKGDLNFVGENGEGGPVQLSIIKDEPGIGPMQLVLVGIAGCTGYRYCQHSAEEKTLTGFKVNVRSKQAEFHPKVYTDIDVEYLLWGDEFKPKNVEQAIALSEQKYR